jgi:hypothetical protein
MPKPYLKIADKLSTTIKTIEKHLNIFLSQNIFTITVIIIVEII